MARKGPPPKPTALKLLHGVDKKNPQRINRDEPQPSVLDVDPPAWLGDEALEVWEHHAPDLVAKKVLTAWDTEAFACWCDAVVRRRTAAAALQEEGHIIDAPVYNKNGDVTGTRRVKNPWTLVLSEADNQVRQYGSRFGLTPSDRAGLKVSGEDDRAGAERLLS